MLLPNKRLAKDRKSLTIYNLSRISSILAPLSPPRIETAEQIKTMEGGHSIGFTRRTPAYNFRQLSVGVGKEMGREGGEGGTSRCRMHVECKAPARSRFRGNRESRWCPSPPSPSSVTFAQVVESGGTRRWARAERRGEERRRRAGRQSATVPNERRGEWRGGG